jgi:hypothetical protein
VRVAAIDPPRRRLRGDGGQGDERDDDSHGRK